MARDLVRFLRFAFEFLDDLEERLRATDDDFEIRRTVAPWTMHGGRDMTYYKAHSYVASGPTVSFRDP